MRICLVAHGFPPVERTGVENYTRALARALVRAGQRVEVFVPRRDSQLPEFSLRREEHGGWAINWVTANRVPADPRETLLVPGMAAVFGALLERERPEIVHFQHLYKVGTNLVQEARARGIPTVYTAHDYYPICHRYTLLRPDLTRCGVRGDSMACSRCDLALGLLNKNTTLGDYQMGALEDQLSETERRDLAAILGDEPERAGLSIDEVDAAFDRRLELDGLRAQAFAGLDLILAPTSYLAEELVRGGLERSRIEVLSYGIENTDLLGLPPVRPDPRSPVRFAFLGGLSKHKGVHVLLEALGRVGNAAELSIWGGSSDQPYEESMRRAARERGAAFRGPYERSALPRILAGTDVVVVPSFWVENQPLVIREAFSARRPVLASRLGALVENVRDGVDGLLFEPGDPADLARVMRRCTQEPGLVERLAAGIQPVKDADQQARELIERYRALVAPASAPKAELPTSLRPLQTRHEELSALPTRELLRLVLFGLEDLGRAWKDELGPMPAVELLASGLGEGSHAQDRLRESRAEVAWLRGKYDELSAGSEDLARMFADIDRLLLETRVGSARRAEHLRSAEAFLRSQESELERTREMLAGVETELADATRYIRTKEDALAHTEDELRRAGEYVRTKEDELRQADEAARAREEELRTKDEAARAREEELRTRDEEARAREEELRTRDEEARAREEELRALREALRAKELELEESQARARFGEERARTTQDLHHGIMRTTAELGMTALHTQQRLLVRVLRPIIERLHAMVNPGTTPQLPADEAGFAELIENLRLVLRALEFVDRELSWRRQVMQSSLLWRVKVALLKRLRPPAHLAVYHEKDSGPDADGSPGGES